MKKHKCERCGETLPRPSLRPFVCRQCLKEIFDSLPKLDPDEFPPLVTSPRSLRHIAEQGITVLPEEGVYLEGFYPPCANMKASIAHDRRPRAKKEEKR